MERGVADVESRLKKRSALKMQSHIKVSQERAYHSEG